MSSNPRGSGLAGEEATIRNVGDRPVLEPAHGKTLLQVLSAMSPLPAGYGFPDVDATLVQPEEFPFRPRR